MDLKLTAIQKGFRETLEDQAATSFDEIVSSIEAADTLQDFQDTVGEDYPIDVEGTAEDALESVLKQIDWVNGLNAPDYVEFSSKQAKAKTPKAEKAARGEKVPKEKHAGVRKEQKDAIAKAIEEHLKTKKEPVIVSDLMVVVQKKCGVSGPVSYRTITDYGQEKFQTEGCEGVVPVTVGAKRAYHLKSLKWTPPEKPKKEKPAKEEKEKSEAPVAKPAKPAKPNAKK